MVSRIRDAGFLMSFIRLPGMRQSPSCRGFGRRADGQRRGPRCQVHNQLPIVRVGLGGTVLQHHLFLESLIYSGIGGAVPLRVLPRDISRPWCGHFAFFSIPPLKKLRATRYPTPWAGRVAFPDREHLLYVSALVTEHRSVRLIIPQPPR